MLDDDTEYDDRQPTDLRSVPPFHFQFSVYCPWAELVQVLVVIGPNAQGGHRILDLRRSDDRSEPTVWTGDVDLPGRQHTFSYRATGNGKVVVAPFAGTLSVPDLFARMSVRATYPGRRSASRAD